jgi:mRNA interferase RelE/StbE
MGDAFEIAPSGYASLRAIQQKSQKREISRAIDGLTGRPDEQGKALLAPFEGIRSLRAAGGRYRILHRVNPRRRIVSILLVGERRAGRKDDIYAAARRLLMALRGEAE